MATILVVDDVNMPEVDGVELLLELRSTRPDLPIIAISGGGLMEKEVLLDNAEALSPSDPDEAPRHRED